MDTPEHTQQEQWEAFLHHLGPIGTFRPLSYEVKAMDMLNVCVRDTSATEKWHGPIHLETCHNHSLLDETLSGFHVVCYASLQGKRRTQWTFALLVRAFIRDITQRGALTHVSAWECLQLYAQAFGVLLKHPRTWRIRAV